MEIRFIASAKPGSAVSFYRQTDKGYVRLGDGKVSKVDAASNTLKFKKPIPKDVKPSDLVVVHGL